LRLEPSKRIEKGTRKGLLMRTVWWLMWRELVNRKASFMVGLAMVAVAVALCAATELVLRAREAAVDSQIDRMGPAVRLVPAGRTWQDLARFDLGATVWNQQELASLQRKLAKQVRRIERRLVSKVAGEGVSIPVIGIDSDQAVSPFGELSHLTDERVALGSELSTRLGLHIGETISLGGRVFRVAAVLPAAANADDLAVFMALRDLQRLLGLPDAVNEIRLFLTAKKLPGQLVARLESGTPAVTVLQADRGEVAESGLHQSLVRHRHMLYTIVAVVVALCMAMWSFLNSAERQLELATAIAVGGTTSTVLGLLVTRAAAIGLLGAAIGYSVGVAIAVVQDTGTATSIIGLWRLPLVLIAGTTLISIFGVLPVAIMTAKADHVALLQE
jgi:putative ABC transport system permease protein